MSNTAVINIRADTRVKKQAQAVAKKLGINLSALINAYLRQLVRTESVGFNLSGQPSDFLLQTLKESKEDIKKGRVSPKFTKANKAIKWLNSSS